MLPVTRFVGTKPSPGDPRATAAPAALTATATIAALNFFLEERNSLTSSLIEVVTTSASVRGDLDEFSVDHPDASVGKLFNAPSSRLTSSCECAMRLDTRAACVAV